MKYAIGLVGNLNPYTKEAIEKTIGFIQEATPAPALVLFLDWAVADPSANDATAVDLHRQHKAADKEAVLPWYASRSRFQRPGAAYRAIYPLHERCNWNRALERVKNAADAPSLPTVHWGKQQLIEEATAAGCERLLCIPPGMWLPADAPAILESGIRPGVVLTYPVMSVRCNLDGEPLKPTEGIGKPPRVTANDLGAGRIPHHDGWWLDLTQLAAHDPGRICNFGAGDEAATLARILHAGEGQAVNVASFLADLPFSHKRGRGPVAQPDEIGRAAKAASLKKHDQHLRSAIDKHKRRGA